MGYFQSDPIITTNHFPGKNVNYAVVPSTQREGAGGWGELIEYFLVGHPTPPEAQTASRNSCGVIPS